MVKLSAKHNGSSIKNDFRTKSISFDVDVAFIYTHTHKILYELKNYYMMNETLAKLMFFDLITIFNDRLWFQTMASTP